MVLNYDSRLCNDVYAGSNQLASQANDGGIDCPEGNPGKFNTGGHAIWQARSHNLSDPQSLENLPSGKSKIFRMLNYACCQGTSMSGFTIMMEYIPTGWSGCRS
jgi:hypothetical protein